jgi:hypothetical protein
MTAPLEVKLRLALRSAVDEAKRNPEFFGRIVATVCEELGVDALVGQFIAAKIKARLDADKS